MKQGEESVAIGGRQDTMPLPQGLTRRNQLAGRLAIEMGLVTDADLARVFADDPTALEIELERALEQASLITPRQAERLAQRVADARPALVDNGEDDDANAVTLKIDPSITAPLPIRVITGANPPAVSEETRDGGALVPGPLLSPDDATVRIEDPDAARSDLSVTDALPLTPDDAAATDAPGREDLERTVVDTAPPTPTGRTPTPTQPPPFQVKAQPLSSTAVPAPTTPHSETIPIARAADRPSTPHNKTAGQTGSGSLSLGTSRSAKAAAVSRQRQMTDADVSRIQSLLRGAREDLTGVNMGGYRIDGKLGSGGMGDVYEATQISLNRKVALKILPAHLANDEEFIERFYAEAEVLATFSHNNIVQVIDVGEAAGVHFFTMEKVGGQTLKQLMEVNGTVPVAVCTNLLKQAVRGLSRAQKAGVIHRDIKPGNMLIDEAGDLKIVDFGLAEKVADDSGAVQSEFVVGTPLYIAPEQARNDAVTFKADIYSLGCTFFHMAVGKPPYSGGHAQDILFKHMEDPIPVACDINTAVPRGFSNILMKMMAKEPEDRHRDYRQLFEAIEAFELQAGIIKSQTDMLGDSLMAIGDKGISSIWVKIAYMSFVGLAIALLAIGIHNVLESQAMSAWNDLLGDVGTVFFALAIGFIAYVAMARKKIVPVYGSISTWMYAHIFCAIVSFFLVTIHSGNFFAWFYNSHGVLARGAEVIVYHDGRRHADLIPLVPFLNSFVFLVVIVSGMVGATIWRDIARQVAVERIASGQKPLKQDTRLTMTVFSQTVFKYWRIVHYPLAVVLAILTVVHVVSILYYRGL